MRYPLRLSLLLMLALVLASGHRPSPAGAADANAVSTGSNHTCALNSSGGVKCWGRNLDGQLGNGTTTGSSPNTTPGDVVGLSRGVAGVAAGVGHTCALTTVGGVKCWGAGLLGDGNIEGSSEPVGVTGLTGVVQIAAGGLHSCALTTGGDLKCWGMDIYGQLGNGQTCPFFPSACPSATDVALEDAVSAVVAGATHTCAVTTEGAVKCWGDNAWGQLGDGTTTQRTEPVDVTGMSSGAIGVAAGAAHTCALLSDGAVQCWGSNSSGEVGDGTTTQRTTPVDVTGLSDATAIAAGGGTTCALRSNGGVKCWGYNNYGQLGNGTTANTSAPGDVAGLTSGVANISVGTFHACAVTASGTAKCWGFNQFGQLGDGTTAQRTSPVSVLGLKAVLGDVNCDGVANSIDAALVLQLTAGLVPSLLCEENADVSRNGQTNSVDAALILQFTAGLLPSLPP